MGSDDPSARTLCVDVAGLEADAVTLDALARLRLTACRCGFQLSLRGSSPQLRELIDFAGLDAVLPDEPVAQQPPAQEPPAQEPLGEEPLGLEPGR
jgi:hypothetical protein